MNTQAIIITFVAFVLICVLTVWRRFAYDKVHRINRFSCLGLFIAGLIPIGNCFVLGYLIADTIANFNDGLRDTKFINFWRN